MKVNENSQNYNITSSIQQEASYFEKKNQIWKIIKPKISEKNLKDAKIALVQNNGIVSQISELAKFLMIIS